MLLWVLRLLSKLTDSVHMRLQLAKLFHMSSSNMFRFFVHVTVPGCASRVHDEHDTGVYSRTENKEYASEVARVTEFAVFGHAAYVSSRPSHSFSRRAPEHWARITSTPFEAIEAQHTNGRDLTDYVCAV